LTAIQVNPDEFYIGMQKHSVRFFKIMSLAGAGGKCGDLKVLK